MNDHKNITLLVSSNSIKTYRRRLLTSNSSSVLCRQCTAWRNVWHGPCCTKVSQQLSNIDTPTHRHTHTHTHTHTHIEQIIC